MRINLHVIVLGAGLTGSFLLKELIAYLHMKRSSLIHTEITIFDSDPVKEEDLGDVYLPEDLGQNRALLIAELLKEQYDYEITVVPSETSLKSKVLHIYKRDYVLLVDCAGGMDRRTLRSDFRQLECKKKLYLRIGDHDLFTDDGENDWTSVPNAREGKACFAWEHVRRMFLVNLAMSRIIAIYEDGQSELGRVFVDETRSMIGGQELLDPLHEEELKHVYHFQLLVVGTGGTGSYFLKEFGAILASLKKESNLSFSLAIIDGDRVEHKNLDRQNFFKDDIGQHKALVLAEALREHYGIEVTAYPFYIDSAGQMKKIFDQMPKPYYKKTLPILIGSVDNHRARQEMEKWFRKTPSCIWLDAANEFRNGEVVAAMKKNGVLISPSRPYYFPEIMRSREKRASELSCGVINQSSPQHRVTNMAAAMLLLSATVGIIKNCFLPYRIAYFDAFKGTVIPVNRADERGMQFEDCE